MSPEFYWIAVAIITIMSASRVTRLVTFDKFPPAMWLRDTYAEFTDKTPRRLKWQRLLFCGWCFSFWATALVVGWADLAGVLDGRPAWGGDGELSIPLWFIINGTLGGSYLAAIVMRFDGDPGDEDEDY